MHINKLFGKALLLLTISVLVAGCGGGGGSGGAAGPVTAFNMVITVDLAALVTNEGQVAFEPGTQFASGFSVRLTRADGSAVGPTTVNLSVSNASLASLSNVDTPEIQAATLSLVTSAGVVNGILHTRDQTGTVQLIAAAFDPAASQNVTRQSTFNIAQGPEPVNRVTIESTRTSIPANRFNVPIFYPNSPYVATLTLRYRNANGVLSAPVGGSVGVAVSPLSLAAFTTLDDPETPEINELFVLIGNGPVDMAGGEATIFVHSFGEPGTVRVSVVAQDVDTQEVFDGEFEIEIVEPASDGRPANVFLNIAEGPQYIQGSGGRTAREFSIFVQDGAGVAVPDPTGGNNNIILEVLTESPASGELLRAVAGNGTNVEGTTIGVATTAGVSAASLLSGTEPGQVRLRATVDIEDNNVSNGITSPLQAESSVVIGDGIPFSVTLTTIPINTLTVLPEDPNAVIADPDPLDGIPPDPNASYTLRVGAIVTDRFGNPPAQAVELQWGLVDSPIEGFPATGSGSFSLSGFDGDPSEGGFTFFSPTGEFTFAGGGVGPNDTLILFGKDVVGNDDLESARTVDSVNSRFSLNVDEAFNFNDFTGASVDNGEVLPYIIGRAQIGNIETGSVTDSNGAAATFMNYPASALGRISSIYVQGTNASLPGSGNFATFADAGIIRYPGLAPLTVTASPSEIRANFTVDALICVADAAGSPVAGQFVSFAVNGDPQAVVTVDGVPTIGLVANPTGLDGCTVAELASSGVTLLQVENNLRVVFSVGAANATIMLNDPEQALLQAFPSSLFGNQLGTTITLLYTDATGMGIPNIALIGDCNDGDGFVSIDIPPDPTDANGESFVVVTANVDALVCSDGSVAPSSPRQAPATNTCTFTTAAGIPTVDVEIVGREVLVNAFSPLATGCP